MEKQKKRKLIKFVFKFTTLVGILFVFAFSLNYFTVTAGTALSSDKLTKALNTPSIKILCENNIQLDSTTFSSNTTNIENINETTINAFLTSEDRSFYSHHGIDYKRLLGALFNNIKSGKLKQGGSTISQQLIKNTHLSSEKTLERKLKEFKLTKQLEKNYTKNQILEIYLNTIYFGNGQYGIENASNYYFSKPASNLTIAESAMLAGIISSPTYNEPVNHFEKATAKKETILKNMNKLGKISNQTYIDAINQKIVISKNSKSTSNQYLKSVLSEASNILNLTENQIRNRDITIHTALNTNLDNFIQNLTNNRSYSPINENGIIPIVQSIVINNKTNQVISYASNISTNLENMKRQPGSAIKPLLVYAPAFEYSKTTPSSFILDEQTTFGSYTPRNSNDKYYGWTTIRNSIEKSLNIPAVKTLSYVGIEKAKNFISQMNIILDEKDNHLAIALGGLTYGTTIKEIADAYSTFSNNGNFSKSSFISKITDNKNRTLYEFKNNNNQVMSEETAYMITDTLISVVKSGTAKKLQLDNIQVASKTGTTNNNKDAWNICYTSEHTIVTYIGNSDNSSLNSNINGSTYPTLINREILKNLYQSNPPSNFNIPDGIIKANLEKQELENKKSQLSLDQKNKSENEEIFTKNTLPEFSDITLIGKLNIVNESNHKPIIKIYSKNANNIKLYRENNNKITLLKEFSNISDSLEYIDESAEKDAIYEYYIEVNNDNKKLITEKIKIKCY